MNIKNFYIFLLIFGLSFIPANSATKCAGPIEDIRGSNNIIEKQASTDTEDISILNRFSNENPSIIDRSAHNQPYENKDEIEKSIKTIEEKLSGKIVHDEMLRKLKEELKDAEDLLRKA